jgi:hypothetical protein
LVISKVDKKKTNEQVRKRIETLSQARQDLSPEAKKIIEFTKDTTFLFEKPNDEGDYQGDAKLFEKIHSASSFNFFDVAQIKQQS